MLDLINTATINIQNNFGRNSQYGQGLNGQISPRVKDNNDSSSSSSSSSSNNNKHQNVNNINISGSIPNVNNSMRNINTLTNSNTSNINIGNTINK